MPIQVRRHVSGIGRRSKFRVAIRLPQTASSRESGGFVANKVTRRARRRKIPSER